MTAHLAQPGILAPLPAFGRSLSFARAGAGDDPRHALGRLADGFDLGWGVVGIGAPVLRALDCSVPGLRPFPALSGAGGAVPATQQALWIYVLGADRSAVFDRAEQVQSLLDGAFRLADAMDTFLYAGGRDLTGYLDGTANPNAAESVGVTLLADGDGLAGSSFAAVQRWRHDLRRFRAKPPRDRDHAIGRRHADNEEIEDAPATAHVKRAEQEDYDPPAFMLRRSMPWTSGGEQGLEFVAYGTSLDAYERVLRRMAGLEDGIVDVLFSFSQPVTGGYYWCPPVAAGRLDLRRLKL